MKRYPFYCTVGEAEFIVMLLEGYEQTRGPHEREGLRKLRTHLTRSIERATLDEALAGGER